MNATRSLAKIRAMRIQDQALADESERAALDARRQSKVYSNAAHALTQLAVKAASVADRLEKDGDFEGATEQREVFKRLQALVERNYEKATEKDEAAIVHERHAFNQRELAAKLKQQIEKET